MKRLLRWWSLPVVLLSLSLLILSCGGSAAQPSPAPSTAKPEESRPTASPQSAATERPAPTKAPAPTESGPLPTAGSPVDLGNQAELLAKVPGYHYESVLRVNEAGKDATYLQVIQDVDAEGNFHIVIYSHEGGTADLDLYYVGGHVYMGQGGVYTDVGTQSSDQVKTLLQAYQLPFQLLITDAADLRPAGPDTVNGQAATKYTANFDRAVSAYVQSLEGVSYSAEGAVWVSDQYGVILKTDLQSTWTKDNQQSSLEAHTEISQVGQVATLAVPK